MQHNKLLNNYTQKSQNNLLQNNQLYMNNNNNMHTQQMQQMYQIKQNQSLMDKDKLKDIIIKPIKLEKVNQNVFNKNLENAEKEYKPTLEEYWKKKTNVPYKCITKFDEKTLKIKDDKDLIIHRVTSKDRDAKEIKEKFDEKQELFEKQNGELKVIYSTSKKGEHKKKFDYTHIYQYRKPKTDATCDSDDDQNHDNLKQDRLNYYKEQQKKQEKNKKMLGSVVEVSVAEGVFDDDDFTMLNNKTNINDNYKSNSDIMSKKQSYLNMRNKK